MWNSKTIYSKLLIDTIFMITPNFANLKCQFLSLDLPIRFEISLYLSHFSISLTFLPPDLYHNAFFYVLPLWHFFLHHSIWFSCSFLAGKYLSGRFLIRDSFFPLLFHLSLATCNRKFSNWNSGFQIVPLPFQRRLAIADETLRLQGKHAIFVQVIRPWFLYFDVNLIATAFIKYLHQYAIKKGEKK